MHENNITESPSKQKGKLKLGKIFANDMNMI
jgi:hypothetical protein